MSDLTGDRWARFVGFLGTTAPPVVSDFWLISADHGEDHYEGLDLLAPVAGAPADDPAVPAGSSPPSPEDVAPADHPTLPGHGRILRFHDHPSVSP